MDEQSINIRLSLIEKNLTVLEEIHSEGFEKYVSNYRTQLSAERSLHIIIEACIDIGNHIIAATGMRRPISYKDVFTILK